MLKVLRPWAAGASLLFFLATACNQTGANGGHREPPVGPGSSDQAGAADVDVSAAGQPAPTSVGGKPVFAGPSAQSAGPAATVSAQAGGDAGGAQAAATLTLDERQTLTPDPTWACGMPDGIPGPLTGQFAFDIDFDVAQVHDLGNTPFGHRRQIDIRGGAIDGAKVEGRVLARGLEYELTLDNGVVELEQIHVLRLGDELVFMRNCGVSPGARVPARVVLDFEAQKGGAHAFLNTGKFVATRVYDPSLRLLRLKVYEVTGALDEANALQVVKPAGRPSQSWECKKGSGVQGEEVYRATVDVATSWLTVGESKYGTRNIIPIHGGSLRGGLTGQVLSGGADYQVIVDGFSLDARYTLQTDDGELIIVRNCGELGALVPTFETRSDGPYAWLNEKAFRSADPQPSADLSQINLTIYESR